VSPSPQRTARSLAREAAELLQLQREDLFAEILASSDACFPEILEPGALRWEAVVAGPATALARIPMIPGVRTVSMDLLQFAAFPAGWDKILLNRALGEPKHAASLLWNLAKHLHEGGRLIVAEAAPCPELPLLARLLRRWHPSRPTAVQIEDWLRATGLQVERSRVEEPTRWSVSECERRIRERAQLAPDACSPAELGQALGELQQAGAGGPLEFVQPIDLVAATRPGPSWPGTGGEPSRPPLR
jgi:hypothetical protein